MFFQSAIHLSCEWLRESDPHFDYFPFVGRIRNQIASIVDLPNRLFRRTSQLKLEYVDVARSFYNGIGTSLGRTYLGLGELP